MMRGRGKSCALSLCRVVRQFSTMKTGQMIARSIVVALGVALSLAMAWATYALATGMMFENGQRFGMIVTGWALVASAVAAGWKLSC